MSFLYYDCIFLLNQFYMKIINHEKSVYYNCLLINRWAHLCSKPHDEAAISKQVDAMIYSWNHHNYDDLKNCTTENTDWVNAVGMWWKGRKERLLRQ